MSDNEVEDIQFLPGQGSSAGKRAVYEPHSLEKCKQMICTPTKSILIVTSVLSVVFLVALLASLARPPTTCSEQQVTESPSVSQASAQAKATNGKLFPWADLRLPKTVNPLEYVIFLHPNLTTFNFEGKVDISMEILESTDSIVLHTKNLTLDFGSSKLVKLGADNDIPVGIEEHLENIENQQLYIKTSATLEKGAQYELSLSFKGVLKENLAGFYKSSYKTKAGEKRWIATTQFEATDARAAFPCFDEPQLKAKFQLSMVREHRHISLFNTEKLSEELFASSDDLMVDNFVMSVKMSTYLVAFVVCDFSATHSFVDGKNVSVYAPEEYMDQTKLASEAAPKILKFYEDFYQVPYPLAKSDHIAIPDFSAGAMENWGLITYRMKALLVNESTAAPYDQQWVVVVIAHELAHQWFGNIVTMKWWNDLWLNEGFASFMEYKGSDHVKPEWQMPDQFLTFTLWHALKSDGLRSSHPISVDVKDPKQIEEIFDAISYDKGASIIRMLDFFLGEDKFRAGLTRYLNKYKYSNAETADLWNTLAETSDGIDVLEVMNTWTLQMGYPVVMVTRDGNTLHASQERFLYNPRGEAEEHFTSPYEYKWHIPLSYTTDRSGYDTHDLTWMSMGPATITLNEGTQWVKLNVNHTGVYRVHYDEAMWDALIQQLQTDHTVFSPADRASLIEDAFALVRSGHLNIERAMDLSKYLRKEEDYIPWYTAMDAFNYINQLMQDKTTYGDLQKYELSLLENFLSQDMWAPVTGHIDKYLQDLVLNKALYLEHPATVNRAKDMFTEWMTHGTELLPNLKALVYRAGAKYGGEDGWQYLWDSYRKASQLETKDFLLSLAATTDAIRLKRLLAWSLDNTKVRTQDTTSLLKIIASNPAGTVITWDFVKKNWADIYKTFHGMAFQFKHFIEIPKSLSTRYDYNEVKQFFETNLKNQDERSISQTLEAIEMKMDWLERNKAGLEAWLAQQGENV